VKRPAGPSIRAAHPSSCYKIHSCSRKRGGRFRPFLFENSAHAMMRHALVNSADKGWK